jgi:outer membrane protein assembly factor BamB
VVGHWHRWVMGLTWLASVSTGFAGDWPEFRGPGQQGHSDERNLPLTWSETENIAWKTDLPGLGWSSPSIVGKRIWLTTAEKAGADQESIKLLAICIDRDAGKILKSVEVFEKDHPARIHNKNSHASPTPVIEGDRVYVHFGAHGTACLTWEGDIVWKTELPYNHRHGPAGSPVLFRDTLIIVCDGTDTQYITALDKKTGKQVWKTIRAEGRMAYSTPTLIEFNGEPQLITAGGEFITAYNPETGKELWKFRYPKGYSVVPRPVVAQGIAFASSGYDDPVFYGVKLGGQGDVTESHLAWKIAKGAPRNASPIVVDDDIYIVSDNGVVTCLDVKTGKVHWQKRVGGDFSSSPLYADGRIYITSEAGLTTVLKPGHEYEVLAENPMPGRIFASLAPVDGAIYLRTEKSLFRIEKK